MCEPPDDTTERRERDATPSPREHDTTTEREHTPGSYYYDDATGYEIYDPAKDEDEEETGESDETTS
ncbi:MAG TPA: hypothetical protein VGW12_20970 [Pyrinomonadaceae bacterium]|nr:hypothetical protein [Pyrinomonadaceae bacterium]